MGKRKPVVPRRRVGVHFLDVASHRASPRIRPDAVTAAAMASNACADVAGSDTTQYAPLSPLPSPPASSSVAAEMPVSGSSTPTSEPSQPPSPVHMPQQSDTAQRVHQPGKPVVSTVPLRDGVHISGHSSNPSFLTLSPDFPNASGDTVTMTVAELEEWKQRTLLRIEDHFTNEQLKRISEFGRVHANLVREAKEYVYSIETQLKAQFERERESLRQQAEQYVAQFQTESERLKKRVAALEAELERTRISVVDTTDVGVSIAFSGGSTDHPLSAPSSSRPTPEVREDSVHDESSEHSGEAIPLVSRLDAVAEAMSRSMEISAPIHHVMTESAPS